MAFCKVCVCGEKIVFQRRMSFPENCPSCGRRTVEYSTYPEDDPMVEELLRQYNAARANNDESPSEQDGNSSSADSHYSLQLDNGIVISIPDEGGIVGRTEIGAEELADYPSVSRKHLKVIPRRSVGVIVEDLSSYGTLIDGKRIEKNSPVRVVANSVITLCNVDAKLIVKEE